MVQVVRLRLCPLTADVKRIYSKGNLTKISLFLGVYLIYLTSQIIHRRKGQQTNRRTNGSVKEELVDLVDSDRDTRRVHVVEFSCTQVTKLCGRVRFLDSFLSFFKFIYCLCVVLVAVLRC